MEANQAAEEEAQFQQPPNHIQLSCIYCAEQRDKELQAAKDAAARQQQQQQQQQQDHHSFHSFIVIRYNTFSLSSSSSSSPEKKRKSDHSDGQLQKANTEMNGKLPPSSSTIDAATQLVDSSATRPHKYARTEKGEEENENHSDSDADAEIKKSKQQKEEEDVEEMSTVTMSSTSKLRPVSTRQKRQLLEAYEYFNVGWSAGDVDTSSTSSTSSSFSPSVSTSTSSSVLYRDLRSV